MNSWVILVIAGLFEMAWVLALKFSNNFSNLFYTALVAIFMILSLVLLSISFKTILPHVLQRIVFVERIETKALAMLFFFI